MTVSSKYSHGRRGGMNIIDRVALLVMAVLFLWWLVETVRGR
jgi:ABC-type multidrug transport system permease subunit